MSTSDQASSTPAKTWAILELFGHSRLAGAVSEQSFGGDTFTRVDVPEVSTSVRVVVQGEWRDVPRIIPAHTKLIGGKAVYSIAFVDEAAALAAAHSLQHQPISSYTLRDALRMLSAAERQQLMLTVEREEAIG